MLDSYLKVVTKKDIYIFRKLVATMNLAIMLKVI